MRNKANTVDFFSTFFGLPQEVENEPFVDFLVLVDLFVNLENEPSAIFVVLVLPGRVDALSEVIDGPDAAGLAVNLIPR